MKKLKLYLAAAIFALVSTSAFAESPVYIKVGDANVKKSLLALPPFQYLGAPSAAPGSSKVGKEFFDTVSNDLLFSSCFEFIKAAAFLEDTSKVGLRPAPGESGGFKFDSWKQIGTEFLIRVGYKILDGELTAETYLYYVPQAKLVLGKSYKANLKDVRVLAHTYANDIVKELTGKKGFFLTRLAVARSTSPGQKEIFVMDWDANNAKQVSAHKSIANSPAWAPDGKTIAYRAFAYHSADKSRNADLFTYDLQTGKRWLVSYRSGINSGASFYPDGRNLILTVSSGGNPDIYKMTLDGKSLTRLTNGPHGSINVEPAVSPDGKQIAFSSDRSGRPMVYTMDSDGSSVKRITIAGEFNSTPQWSPDGKKIVFAGADKGHYDLFVMDPDGGNMIRLTSATKPSGRGADNIDPSFSPDGLHIMFVSNRTGRNQLYIVDLDGENERRITFDQHEYSKPMWSPYLD
jgi:TolB protein